jgi:hypothetical protein
VENIDISIGTLVRNIENSTHKEHIMTKEQILDLAKMERKFNAKTTIPKQISTKDENYFIKKAKI